MINGEKKTCLNAWILDRLNENERINDFNPLKKSSFITFLCEIFQFHIGTAEHHSPEIKFGYDFLKFF